MYLTADVLSSMRKSANLSALLTPQAGIRLELAAEPADHSVVSPCLEGNLL